MSDDFDLAFPRPQAPRGGGSGHGDERQPEQGLEARITGDRAVEGLAVGRYVVIRGQQGRRFFGMVTDIALESRHPEVEQSPPDEPDGLAQVYRGHYDLWADAHHADARGR